MQVLLEASLAEQVAQDLQSLEGIPTAGALAELNFRLLTEHRTLEEIRLQGVPQLHKRQYVIFSLVHAQGLTLTVSSLYAASARRP